MMKSVTRILHTSLLLYCFLNTPCDARRVVGRGREPRSGQARNLKEVKSCKGKAKGHVGVGKAATCAPSASPSAFPSSSPSSPPSDSPSKSPSDAPSGKPSVSMAPSLVPSEVPSDRPSKEPSDVPSKSPSSSPSQFPSDNPSTSPSMDPSETPSSEPSSFPSVSPSDYPSESPSNFPSPSPSAAPSDAPSTKPSSFPSVGPSVSPSMIPSQLPSEEPSEMPSSEPSISAAPSISSAPSLAFFETIRFGSDVKSTCILVDPSETYGGNMQDQLLVFDYLLFIPSTVVDKEVIVDVMEERIHNGLVQEFLKCDMGKSDSSNDGGKDFYVWSISPNPADYISSDPCDPQLVLETIPTPPADAVCMEVQAALELEVYFPPIRRNLRLDFQQESRRLEPALATTADPQVMAASGDYLVEAMARGEFVGDDVLQTRFLGFVTDEQGHAVLEGGTLKVAGAEGQLMSQPKDSRIVGGAMTMAAAALCLIVVLALVLRRRRKRTEAFLQHLDGMTTWSNFGKDDDDDPGTEILGETASLGWFSDDFLQQGIQYLQERDRMRAGLDRQDVHRCTSAFCAICLNEQKPTFIAANALNTNDILEDLQCTIIEDDTKSQLTHPDTVIL